MSKTKLEALMEKEKISWTDLSRETKISSSTLRYANARPISTWTTKVVMTLAEYFNENSGDFLNYLLGNSKINGIEINEIEQTIQRVEVQDRMQFRLMVNVIENNLNLGYLPTKEDIEYLLSNWKNIDNNDLEKIHQQFLDQCKLQIAQINLQNK